LYTEYSEKYINAEWTKLENGRYYKVENMLDPQNKMMEYNFHGTTARWRTIPQKLEALWNEPQTEVPNSHGRIKLGKDGNPTKRCRIIFLDERQGVALQDIWDDISYVAGGSKEKIGYPTQKPLALLERIIKTSTNEGDTILDPFMGGGTTIMAAEKLHRKWIGIDQSVQAIKVTDLRLQNDRNLFSAPYTVQLHKYDYDTLRNKPAFEFERWIVEQYGGQANTKQRGDFGVDGKTTDGTPLQVKRSDNIGRDVIDKFPVAAKRFDERTFDQNKAEGKPVGFIIAFSFGKGAIEEVARLKNKEGITIKLVRVEEIVPIAHKPTLKVSFQDMGMDKKGLRDIAFTAQAETDSGIEFYAWDWHFQPEKGFKAAVMIDKEGKQTQKFKAGTHSIAVRVIDNEGLENTEVITLKVNGVVANAGVL
jgi:DNA methylase